MSSDKDFEPLNEVLNSVEVTDEMRADYRRRTKNSKNSLYFDGLVSAHRKLNQMALKIKAQQEAAQAC